VLKRTEEIGQLANLITQRKLDKLPEFFHVCYCRNVLKYLIAAREQLQWETSRVDATLMAIILVNLHGKRGSCLSNQMRQGKAMEPDYSIRWWKARRMKPPELDPVEFLKARV
jgi:hypothetical protein